jgi:hypothetical protein
MAMLILASAHCKRGPKTDAKPPAAVVGVQSPGRPIGSVQIILEPGKVLPGGKVVSCVTSSFVELSFPKPEKGIVRATVPYLLTPA